MSSATPDPYAPRPQPPAGAPEKSPWWCSWPVIIVLELLCFIPAVILVWQRPTTLRKTKVIATVILIGIPIIATILDYAHKGGS